MDGLELQDKKKLSESSLPAIVDPKRYLLSLMRIGVAESLAQYILKRKATLQVVVNWSRNLCIELLHA